MSIQVQVGELADAMAVYRFAYLVTISDDGRAHVVAVTPRWDGRALIVEGLGRRSAANLAARPAVTLVWPPLEPQGYSLILDGEVSGDAA
ncbi:MAG TPA: pyridoxamine 5'-phosphate oxidase family protein, partial [Nakamurella sp.]|nr:pyridoxamine 5'-phosphate oxidase family protein [Nakamurella sp.]